MTVEGKFGSRCSLVQNVSKFIGGPKTWAYISPNLRKYSITRRLVCLYATVVSR